MELEAYPIGFGEPVVISLILGSPPATSVSKSTESQTVLWMNQCFYSSRPPLSKSSPIRLLRHQLASSLEQSEVVIAVG